MSHAWRASIESVGQPSSGARLLAKATRDAHIAAAHATVTAEDEALWTALTAALTTLISTLDPSGTAKVRATLSASGAHAGWTTANASLSVTFDQPGPDPAQQHVWQSMASSRLTVGEVLLARALMAADISGQTWAVSAQDTAVFDALVVAAQTLTDVIDPGSTGSVMVNLAGQVSVGDLRKVTASVGVSSAQPAAAAPTPIPLSTIQAKGDAILGSGPAAATRLAVGTNGQVLTADSTQASGARWSTPAAVPADPLIVVVKPSPQSVTSNTALADIAGLTATLLASSVYLFEFWLPFRTAALTTGLALAMNGPVTPALVSYRATIPFAADGSDSQWEGAGTAYDDVIVSTAVPALNLDYMARIDGVIRTGVAGGTLAPRFRSEVNGSAVTIQQGAVGLIRKVA